MTATTAATTTATTTSATPVQGVDRRAERARDLAWTGFRAVVGFLFACHGAQGLFGTFGGVDGAGATVPALSIFGLSSLICLAGGAFVLVGLWTRTSAVLSSGTMAFAYFTVHQPMGSVPLVNMGEPAALNAWAFLVIAAYGPGRYAVDTLVRRARKA
jgi:putative oxidoreductase